ncbi:hypothetical protein [Streptomyces chryseus]|uniref:Secreted protein n=1 Tax=Streptomyces chryseus TaxID=68186 RepID=A0ABQ3DLJ7_9ACTN|nr:hypothetical protein [Streptomyces chryseus]GGX09849.1 hypothetical protein GCM10010353_26610 [Streptomyces chryseus]GHB06349.1 hypothetical protein GCM10010346_32000 [Streptomyces chryseus]
MGMLIAIGAGILAVVVLGLVVTVILVARNRRNAAPAPVYGGYQHQHPAQRAQPGPPYPQAPQNQPDQPPYQPHPYAQQPPYPGQ